MTTSVRLGALCWALCVEFFVAQAIAQIAWPEYNLMHNDISTLGATVCGAFNPAPHGTKPVCSTMNLVFNIGLLLHGVFVTLGTILTWTLWPQTRTAKLGLWLIGIGGVGAAVAGAFPYNTLGLLHGAGASSNFAVGTLGILLLGIALFRHHRALSLFSVVCGAAAIAGALLFAFKIYLDIGRGSVERLAVYPQTIWYMVLGCALLAGVRLKRAEVAELVAGRAA